MKSKIQLNLRKDVLIACFSTYCTLSNNTKKEIEQNQTGSSYKESKIIKINLYLLKVY